MRDELSDPPCTTRSMIIYSPLSKTGGEPASLVTGAAAGALSIYHRVVSNGLSNNSSVLSACGVSRP